MPLKMDYLTTALPRIKTSTILFPLTYILLALIPILSYVNRVPGWQREGSTVVQPLTYHLVTIQRQG